MFIFIYSRLIVPNLLTMLYNELKQLYLTNNLSVSKIAVLFKCSENKINYWLKKYNIPKRSISEAVYLKHNPKGDPFKVRDPANLDEAVLFGIGLGLYWGEGTKSNKASIRLGNTNPRIVVKFIDFLVKIYGIRKEKIKFGLQIFSDMKPARVMEYWIRELRASPSQFQKIVITPSRGIGNYRQKTKYGVLTVYYHNKKLRDILCNTLEKL